eukprot:TRINITY_DN431_c0_g1_i1.p1 TRINITY_DN431_c0_g1~~TRINITY_DN431_c0_g1_i1.p1  ORF type:complete len:212 (+),score=43.73 TRINITY_DN431_c0_g1_i1:58-693(+)
MAARFVLLVVAGIATLALSQNCDVPGAACNGDEASLLQSAGKEAVAVKAHAQQQQKAHAQKQRGETEIRQHNSSLMTDTGLGSLTCEKDTGGKCGWTTCDASRGGPEAVECTSGWWKICRCKQGYCAVNGRCVKDDNGYERDEQILNSYCEDQGMATKSASEQEAHRKCSADPFCAGVLQPGNHPNDWLLCKLPLQVHPSQHGSKISLKRR